MRSFRYLQRPYSSISQTSVQIKEPTRHAEKSPERPLSSLKRVEKTLKIQRNIEAHPDLIQAVRQRNEVH